MKTIKPTLQNLIRRVESLGGSVELESISYGLITIDPPNGMVWECDDLHYLCHGWETDRAGRAIWIDEKADSIEDALERVAVGVVPCDIANCDICNE